MSEPLCGILVIDKPEGLTSMQAVARVRRRAGGARTGHAGTLDPLATGVLVMALGKATRLIERLMATDKRYRTLVNLAAFTSTDDREGEPQPVAVAAPPLSNDVQAAVSRFVGRTQQRPPAFSAVKVGGRRAYKLARQGAPVELAARAVTIHSIQVVTYAWPHVELDVHCAKGTYIRSLARDLGVSLGTGGFCESIRRTAVGPFDEHMAQRLDDLPERMTQRDLLDPAAALALIGDQPAAGASA
jgi:tRNA pseudouridine55 synthase